MVYYYGNINLNLGDKITVYGTLQPLKVNTNFNLFNYKKYMLSLNTYWKMNVEKIKLIHRNTNILYKMKNNLIDKINNKSSSQYLKAFILGDTSNIDSNIVNSYKDNGIIHLFSISGMHVTFLSSILLYILNKIKKTNFNYFIISLFLLFYMFLTNFSNSIIRSTLLFICFSINSIFDLKVNKMNIFLLILSITIIINPYNIYNTGYIFSYTISFYLLLFNKIINSKKNYITKIFITSIISFLVSIPILINNYFSINLMTIINNIIFVPFVSFFIFPLSFISLILPKLDIIYDFLINILENLSLFILKFKFEIILCHINLFMIIFYYIIITFILYKISKDKYIYLLFIVLIIFVHSNINIINKKSFITFLDVDQGDSALMHLNNKNILIDTGGLIYYDISNNIINYLKSEGIKKLDYLILTHGDFDHMGASINLVNNFKIKKVILNCGEFNELEKELIEILNKKEILYYSCIKELKINNNKLYFLNNGNYDNENDNSNVIYMKLNNYKFLFMGDATSKVEKLLLKKYDFNYIDVLKVGHHGSNTSSSKEFINSIIPKYSIISVGKNNRYGHPNKEVLKNLDNSKIYRTDYNGSIKFIIKNSRLKVYTCIS